MNKELSRRFGRKLSECFEQTVGEPLPASWLELLDRLERREQEIFPARSDRAGERGTGQSD